MNQRKPYGRSIEPEKRIVDLSESQTSIQVASDERKAALDAALWVTASPHEWTWTTEQQAAMARYVLWAHQRLSAIGQLASGELKHCRSE